MSTRSDYRKDELASVQGPTGFEIVLERGTETVSLNAYDPEGTLRLFCRNDDDILALGRAIVDALEPKPEPLAEWEKELLAPTPFNFYDPTSDPDPRASLVFQALGAASVAWANPEGAGEFDSTRAKEIGEKLIAELDKLAPSEPAVATAEVVTLEADPAYLRREALEAAIRVRPESEDVVGLAKEIEAYLVGEKEADIKAPRFVHLVSDTADYYAKDTITGTLYGFGKRYGQRVPGALAVRHMNDAGNDQGFLPIGVPPTGALAEVTL